MNKVHFTRARLFMLGIALTATHAFAAWHDEHAGQDVRAHHVRLTGHGGNNPRLRQIMLEEYVECAKMNPGLGLPVKPLSAGIPAVISSHEIDIYYAPGRTIAVSTGTLHTLNRNDCGIEEQKHAMLKFLGPDIQTCEIDLIRRKAKNPCGTATGTLSKIDLSKSPPHVQAQAAQILDRVRQSRFSGPAAGQIPGTGTYRVISGLRCEVYRQPAIGMEICIARPDGTFPIPPSAYNAAVPGLLLSAQSEAMTVTAGEIHLDIGLSESAFAIPGDIQRKASGQ